VDRARLSAGVGGFPLRTSRSTHNVKFTCSANHALSLTGAYVAIKEQVELSLWSRVLPLT